MPALQETIYSLPGLFKTKHNKIRQRQSLTKGIGYPVNPITIRIISIPVER